MNVILIDQDTDTRGKMLASVLLGVDATKINEKSEMKLCLTTVAQIYRYFFFANILNPL